MGKDKKKELFLQILRKEFKDNNTELTEKDVEFALFGFEIGRNISNNK